MDYNLTLSKITRIKLLNILDDLQVQSMLFDMEIDYETLTLQPKSDYKEPFWLTNWKEKERGKDFEERFDIDAE